MGKLTYGFGVSVDGYTADEDGGFEWAAPDEELHRFWNDRAKELEVTLYGRRLYELMSAFWPTADQDPAAPPVVVEFARLWRETRKVVFSRTLEDVGWNCRLERGDVVAATRRLKAETDGVLEVGGPTLAAPLVRAGLVDEFLVVVNPTAVGGGTPFFPRLDSPLGLDLKENRTFPSGAVLLRYVPRSR